MPSRAKRSPVHALPALSLCTFGMAVVAALLATTAGVSVADASRSIAPSPMVADAALQPSGRAEDPRVLSPASSAAGWLSSLDLSRTHVVLTRNEPMAAPSARSAAKARGRVAGAVVDFRTTGLQQDGAARQAVAFLNGFGLPLQRLGIRGGPDEGTDFAARSILVDDLGLAHVRCDQYFAGARVFGGQLVVHLDASGDVTAVNGVVGPIGGVDPVPALTGERAREIAFALYGRVPEHLLIPADPERMILPQKDGPHLVWRVPIHVASPQEGDACWEYFIDARDGRLRMRYDALESDTPVAGDGIGVRGDLKTPLQLLQTNQGYAMVDVTRREGGANGGHMRADQAIVTFDAQTLDDPQQVMQNAQVIVNPTEHLRGTEGSVLRNAVDAHWNAAVTYDYYNRTFGWNSFDNQGSSLPMVVNYGKFFNNAFWNGRFMAFGQGDGKIFIPLAGALDVTAHELTHAVTSSTADLIYQDQSGALNESISDIFGAMVDSTNWTIGEEIVGPQFGRAFLRSMSDPPSGNQPDHMDDYQHLTPDQDHGGVHVNSGIPNKAAWLLSEGGTFHGVTVPGIGRDRSQQVWFRALTTIMTPSTSFGDAREACIQAARQLFPGDDGPASAAANAWAAVGVGEPVGGTGHEGSLAGTVTRPGGPLDDVRVAITNPTNTRVIAATGADHATGAWATPIAAGSYLVFAYADVNHNGDYDAGEPFGFHDANGDGSVDAADVVTVADAPVTGVDVTVNESTGTTGLPAPQSFAAVSGAQGGVPLTWSPPAGTAGGGGTPGGDTSGSLAGTVSRSDGAPPDSAVVAVFTAGSTQALAVQILPPGTTSFTFRNVPAGSYTLASGRDLDHNGRLNPGDLFGQYDANGDGQADLVALAAGGSLTGLDIVLYPISDNPAASVSGVISRNDGGSASGAFALFLPTQGNPDDPSTPAQAPVDDQGAYQAAVRPGTYNGYAILDHDENGMLNRGDWFGWTDSSFVVSAGQAKTGVSMVMQEIPVDFYSEIEPNDAPEQATAVSEFSATFGAISSGSDEDWFSFTGTQDLMVTIQVDAYKDGQPLDSYLELYNFNVSTDPLAQNDDENPPSNLDPKITTTMPSTGTYYVRLAAVPGTQLDSGSYTLYILQSATGPGLRAEGAGTQGMVARVAPPLRELGRGGLACIRMSALGVASTPRTPGRRAEVAARRRALPLDNGAVLQGYNVYRSATAGVPVTPGNRILTLPAALQSALDSQVQGGQTYHYVVTAVYDQGESGPSNEVSATPSTNGPPVACGDLNNSGGIDLADVSDMLKALVDGNQEGLSLAVADINRNGRLDVADVAQVTRAFGTGQPLDCPPPAQGIEEGGRPAAASGRRGFAGLLGAAATERIPPSGSSPGSLRVRVRTGRALRAFSLDLRLPDAAHPVAHWSGGGGVDCFPTSAAGVWRVVAARYPPGAPDEGGIIIDGVGGATLLKAQVVGEDGRAGWLAVGPGGSPVQERTILLPARPNPFSGQTTLSFALAAPSRVSLRIRDVTGRAVRSLLDADKGAGSFEVVWDGRDDSGRAVASGVYFTEFRAGPLFQSRKLLLVQSGRKGGAR